MAALERDYDPFPRLKSPTVASPNAASIHESIVVSAIYEKMIGAAFASLAGGPIAAAETACGFSANAG
jgi:hypothetical protein